MNVIKISRFLNFTYCKCGIDGTWRNIKWRVKKEAISNEYQRRMGRPRFKYNGCYQSWNEGKYRDCSRGWRAGNKTSHRRCASGTCVMVEGNSLGEAKHAAAMAGRHGG